MPYIYKITNKINGKCYVGKTLQTVQKRWLEHQYEANQSRSKDRPLYRAINKYGIENFEIETIEEIQNLLEVDINEREKYWIEYYGSFKNGYNATYGGDGKHYLDYELISKMYDEIKDCSKIAEILNIDPGSVSKAIKSTGKTLLSNGRNTKKLPKIIHMYSLNDEYKKTFPSVQEAVRWCVEHNLCKKICSGARSHIAACANGERKTAYQHKWKYADNTTDSIKS